MKVSKHHYALALAEKNNKVYFIEPPDLKNTGISIRSCNENDLISIVSYRPVFRGRRFLPRPFYRFLLRSQVRQLMKAIGKKPDELWCFHGYLFENLGWFKAQRTIFFAADQFLYKHYPPEVDTADISLAISDTIYERIRKSGKPVYQVNHGLQKPFVQMAEAKVQKGEFSKTRDRIIAGYTGNLRMEALDRGTMKAVILSHPEVQFLFWGSYDTADLNLGGLASIEANDFITFLMQQPNVQLRGVVNGEELQRQMQEADMFWLCWKINEYLLWDGSNSHKILEYLATGSPVVSHFVSSYKDRDLLYMLPGVDNTGFADLFGKVIQLVKDGEPAEKVHRRLRWAIDNSYEHQLQRIGALFGKA